MNNETDYATETRKARRKGVGGTAEFFTPSDLVKHMCDKVDEETWADPKKTFLEPSAGNGNFCVEIIERRLSHGVDWETTLKTLFAVELMSDNVIECRQRIINLLKEKNIEGFDERKAQKILCKNIVCSDFFKWDFENWRPMQEMKQLSLF